MKKVSAIFLFVLAILGCNPGDDNQPEPVYNFNDSLIAYYPLDGNGNDYSGNNRNLANYKALATINHFGQNSKAMLFNGANTILTSGTGADECFDPAGSFTVSIWVRIDDLNMDQNIVSKMESGGYELVFKSETKKISFTCYINGTYYELAADEQAQMGKWYQLCGVFSKGQTSSQFSFYINGTLKNSTNLNGDQTITPSNVPVILGGLFDPFGYYYSTFKGAMDELRFYNKAFSSQEISGLYNAENIKMVYASVCEGYQYDFGGDLISDAGTYFHTFTGSQGQDSMVTLFLTISPVYNIETNATIVTGEEYVFGDTVLNNEGTYHRIFQSASGCDSSVTLHLIVTEFDFNDGLIAYYPLNGNGYDASGNHKNLINYGATPVENRFGYSSSAMEFTNYSSYFLSESYTEDYFDISNDFTLSAWVRLDDISKYQAIISKAESGGYAIHYWASNKMKIYFACYIYGTWYELFGLDSPQLDNWYHVVGTVSHTDGNTYLKFYINGVLQKTTELYGYQYVSDSPVPLGIGTNPGLSSNADFYNGAVDEVRLYNKSYSESEIQYLFTFDLKMH